jgi:hypothetical protein
VSNYTLLRLALDMLKNNIKMKQTFDSFAIQVSVVGVFVVTLNNDYLYTFKLYLDNVGLVTVKTLIVGLVLILLIKESYKENT